MKKYKKQAKVAMAMALATSSVAGATSTILAKENNVQQEQAIDNQAPKTYVEIMRKDGTVFTAEQLPAEKYPVGAILRDVDGNFTGTVIKATDTIVGEFEEVENGVKLLSEGRITTEDNQEITIEANQIIEFNEAFTMQYGGRAILENGDPYTSDTGIFPDDTYVVSYGKADKNEETGTITCVNGGEWGTGTAFPANTKWIQYYSVRVSELLPDGSNGALVTFKKYNNTTQTEEKTFLLPTNVIRLSKEDSQKATSFSEQRSITNGGKFANGDLILPTEGTIQFTQAISDNGLVSVDNRGLISEVMEYAPESNTIVNAIASNGEIRNENDGGMTLVDGGTVLSYDRVSKQMTTFAVAQGASVYEKATTTFAQDALIATGDTLPILANTTLTYPKDLLETVTEGLKVTFAKGALYAQGNNNEKIAANEDVLLGKYSVQATSTKANAQLGVFLTGLKVQGDLVEGKEYDLSNGAVVLNAQTGERIETIAENGGSYRLVAANTQIQTGKKGNITLLGDTTASIEVAAEDTLVANAGGVITKTDESIRFINGGSISKADGSTVEIPAGAVFAVAAVEEVVTPVAKDLLITVVNEMPNAEDAIANKDDLQDVVSIEWEQQPDVSQVVEETTGVVKVTYADGSSHTVSVKVKVNAKAHADTYTPEVKADSVLAVTEMDMKLFDVSSLITNKEELPNGTAFTWKQEPDKTAMGTQTAVISVTYPDKSQEDVTVTLTLVQDLAAKNTPVVKQGYTATINEQINAEDMIENKDALEYVDTITWKQALDTSVAGEVTGMVTVTYADGTSEDVAVTINVQGNANTNTDADTYEPVGAANLVVQQGAQLNAEDMIANKGDLPQNTKYAWKQHPDTSVVGEQTGVLTVTYPDGTSEDVTITVNVHANTNANTDADTYEPVGKTDVVVEQGTQIEAADMIANKEDLPQNTKYTWKQSLDTNEIGTQTGIISITYPDGTSEEVEVSITVVEKEGVVTPAEPVQPEGDTTTSTEGVQTGDATQIGLWAALMGISASMLALFKRKKDKKI